jgi:hypothetical protein
MDDDNSYKTQPLKEHDSIYPEHLGNDDTDYLSTCEGECDFSDSAFLFDEDEHSEISMGGAIGDPLSPPSFADQEPSTERVGYDEDNLYEIPMIPIHKSDVGCSLPKTRELKESQLMESHRERRTSFCFGALVVLLILVVVSLNSSLKARNEENSAGVSADILPSESNILHFLADNGVSSQLDLKHPEMPQYRAVQWLAYEDPAPLPLPEASDPDHNRQAYMYLVRYVMAVNYFATGGPTSWKDSLNFLSDRPVCEWSVKGMNPAMNPSGLWCDDEGLPESLILGTLVCCSLCMIMSVTTPALYCTVL